MCIVLYARLMDNPQLSYRQMWQSLLPLYDEGEARAMARMLLEEKGGLSFTDICVGREAELSAPLREEIASDLQSLIKGVPLQHVLGKETFCGRTFGVSKDVLIPRPETEELCRMIVERMETEDKHSLETVSILDIGTGSGCIAITLALDIAQARVSAWDISAEALLMASTNAKALGAEIDFSRQDALNAPDDSGKWDIIVSNPPYILNKEAEKMHANVLDHEPHTALFVPDDNPLLFYSAIASYARKALKPGGMLAFEINPLCADDMLAMLDSEGFTSTSLLEDGFGKKRFTLSFTPNE